MGLLDDLAMGFGLKERTEDYDARTARTIAASEAAGGSNDAMALAKARNPQHSSFLPVSRSRGAQQYLGSRGYAEGYTPQVVPRNQDDRPFMQRLLFSPDSPASPTPYAIGPLTMDQPLPKFGLLGLLSGLGGMFGRDVQEMGPPQTTVRPMLRPEGFAPYMSSGQPETRFDTRTEAEPIDYSDGIPVQDPATIAATEALANLSDMPPSYVPAMPSAPASPAEIDINFLENTRVPRAIDLERPLPVMPKDPTYYSGIDVDVPAIPAPDIMQLPNGLYVNTRTGKVFR